MMDLQQQLTADLSGKITFNQDNVLRECLKNHGFNISDIAFLKENIECITVEGDPFEHYYFHYGQPDEKRLISIERMPSLEYGNSEDGRSVNVTVSKRYY